MTKLVTFNMTPNEQILSELTKWLLNNKFIHLSVLFGSASRPERTVGGPTPYSDVNVWVVTKNMSVFSTTEWARGIFSQKIVHYYSSADSRSGEYKVIIGFEQGGLELMLVQYGFFRQLGWFDKIGISRLPGLKQKFNETLNLFKPGYRVIVGNGKLIDKLVTAYKECFQSKEQVRSTMSRVRTDITWIKKKVLNGEFMAAQRRLMLEVQETNIRLLYEYRKQTNQISFDWGRRLEEVLEYNVYNALALHPALTASSLNESADKALAFNTWIGNKILSEVK